MRFQPSLTTAVILAVMYGLITRLIFGLRPADQFLSTLSIGFLCFVPVALGSLTVYFLPEAQNWRGGITAPLLPSLVFLGAVIVFNLELFICVVMAAPLFFAASSIGGLIMVAVIKIAERHNRKSNLYSTLLLVLIAPYLLTSLETRSQAPVSLRQVDNQITINASPEVVWQHITSVAPIAESEHSLRVSHLIGIPRPVQASLNFTGIGSVRHSSWEGGVAFIETITAWEPQSALHFAMAVDPDANVPAPFSEIGGEFFDVVEGHYRIEPIGENQVILHLSSTHRLSTRINAYGGLWTDFIMRDVQGYILEIIKARCETSFRASG